MRRVKHLILTVTIFSMVNNVVAQNKEVVYHFPADTAMVDKSQPDYIDLANGKKIDGKITTVNLIKKNVYDKITGTIAIGSIEYDLKEVSGYQYQGIYFSRADSKKHMIVRLKNGKINLYNLRMNAEKSNDRGIVEFQWTHIRHLIQKGTDGKIEIFSVKTLEDFVSDYQPAADIMKQYWENKSTMDSEKYLEQAIDVYNHR